MKINYKNYLYLVLGFLLETITPAFSSNVITVTPLAELESGYSIGYFYRGYFIENVTSEKITVELIAGLSSSDNNKLNSVKKIELAPHETKEEYIYCSNVYGNYRNTIKIEFFVDNVLEFKDYSSARHSWNTKSILLDNKISNLDSDKLFSASKQSRYGSPSFETFTYKNNLDLMPTNWIAYSQYNALMYKDSTFKSMTTAVQNAIFEYVRAGGKLIIVGDIDLPDDARKLSKTSGEVIEKQCSVGFGGLMCMKETIFDEMIPAEAKEERNTYAVGGSRRFHKKETAEESPKENTGVSFISNQRKIFRAEDVLEEVKRFVDTNKTRFTNDDFRDFSVISEYSSKYEPMSSSINLGILVIFFAIVLGPVNYYVLRKKDKKILVFLTTPIIAFVCCLLVFGYDLIFESWRFDIFRQSVTLLYQNENTAITCGNELFISGKNRNNSLEYPLSSIIIPYTGSREFEIGSSLDRVIKLENVQKFSDNWIKSKRPLALANTSIKQSRARLEIKKDGDSIEVLNGLGADIKKAEIVSEDGSRMYLFENIKSGAVAHPVRSLKYYPDRSNGPELRASYDFLNISANKLLKSGEYVAYLDSDPFLAQGIDSKATIHELGCIVVGRYMGGSK